MCHFLKGVGDLGVTTYPPPRKWYVHNLTTTHIFNFSMLFNVCEFFCYPCRATPIEIGGDVLALGIPFIFTVFWKLAGISPSFWFHGKQPLCIYTFQPLFAQVFAGFLVSC